MGAYVLESEDTDVTSVTVNSSGQLTLIFLEDETTTELILANQAVTFNNNFPNVENLSEQLITLDLSSNSLSTLWTVDDEKHVLQYLNLKVLHSHH